MSASSTQILAAIQNAAGSVNPYAAQAAILLPVFERELCRTPMRERKYLTSAVQKLPTCWKERYWPLKFSIKYTHMPSSTDYFFSYLEGWYLAEIEHDGRRQLVVGFQVEEIFLQKLQRFVATLPVCPEWAREQSQIKLKEKQLMLRKEERYSQQLSFKQLLQFKERDDQERAALQKPPRPPTKAETRAAFFVLFEWLQGSKKTKGVVYDRTLQNVVCLPSISEMESILKKAKRLGLEVLSDDQISEMVKQEKVDALSDADNARLIALRQDFQAKWDARSDAAKARLSAWAEE
jgi:hypothetical protein